jgi:Protein of unknown function N-terminus (DUF3323)
MGAKPGRRSGDPALHSPPCDRRELNAQKARAREAFWTWARAHPVVRERPVLEAWLERLRTQGLLSRLSGASGRPEQELLERALQVIARLPATGEILPVFAAEVLGNAHALDPGRPETSLVLGAIAALVGRAARPEAAR